MQQPVGGAQGELEGRRAGHHSFTITDKHLFPGKPTLLLAHRCHSVRAKPKTVGPGQQRDLSALYAHFSSPFSTSLLHWHRGWTEGRGGKEKRRNEMEWDRARAAPRDLEAVYDANMYKSSALPPLRKEPKIEV